MTCHKLLLHRCSVATLYLYELFRNSRACILHLKNGFDHCSEIPGNLNLSHSHELRLCSVHIVSSQCVSNFQLKSFP